MDLLKIGQKLSIFFQKDDCMVEISCVISDLLEDRINIELPQYFMRYIEFLDVGRRLTVRVFSKVGTIDFNTIVITSPLENSFSVELDYNAMKLTPNNEIPFVPSVERLNITKDGMLYKVRTFEISMDKLNFISEKKFELDEVLDCELLLPEPYGIIKFKGILTHVDDVYENEYQITYSTISEEHRQNLLYYMYVYSNKFD